MPTTGIIIVSVIVFAFLARSGALAWGDYQTRDIARASRERALTAARVPPGKQNAGPEQLTPVASESGKASVEA